MTLTILYFAWVRERIGQAEETVTLPDHVATVGDLVAWLVRAGVAMPRRWQSPSGCARRWTRISSALMRR